MRERLAIALSVVTIGLLAGLSLLFACSQNRPDEREPADPATAVETAPAAPATAPPATDHAADSAHGYAVFREQTCERCHSVAGVGSPRYPLDGVGARRTTEELRAWTIAAESVADSLAPSVARAKRRWAGLPAAAMDALLHFLASLRQPR